MGLYGPKVVWVFVAWYSAEFWRTNLDDVPCTVEEMEAAADGAFVLGFYYWNPVLEKGIAGLTGKLVLHNSIINDVPGTIEVMEAAADRVLSCDSIIGTQS